MVALLHQLQQLVDPSNTWQHLIQCNHLKKGIHKKYWYVFMHLRLAIRCFGHLSIGKAKPYTSSLQLILVVSTFCCQLWLKWSTFTLESYIEHWKHIINCLYAVKMPTDQAYKRRHIHCQVHLWCVMLSQKEVHVLRYFRNICTCIWPNVCGSRS